MPTITPHPASRPYGHGVVRSLVRTRFARPPKELVDRVALADVSVLSELVGGMYTMNGQIRPLALPALPLTGVVSTAKCPPGDNMGLVKALTLVEPGDVLVVDAQGFSHWCLGGFQLLQHARATRGLAGLVVNGAYRDVDAAQSAGFPIYGTGLTPYSGPKAGPFEVNVPVCCGGVVVQPGDVVSASCDGVVVVPQRSLEAVAEALVQRAAQQVQDGDDVVRRVFALAQSFDCDELPAQDQP